MKEPLIIVRRDILQALDPLYQKTVEILAERGQAIILDEVVIAGAGADMGHTTQRQEAV